MRNLLLFACLLFIVTPLHAQDPESPYHVARDKAWLAVYADPYGEAVVTLEFRAKARDREQLKRALAESVSFPLQFRNLMDLDIDDEDQDQQWTIISATSAAPFGGGMFQKTCRIDVQSLLPELQQNQIKSLNVRVVFADKTRGVEIKGAERTKLGPARMDQYEANFDVRGGGTAKVMAFTLGYDARDLSKQLWPLLLFLLLPALWTSFSARRRTASPEELWGGHLRFLHRLLNIVWLIWLPVYSLSGVSEILDFVFFPDRRGVGQVVNVAFYFIPPIIAMLLCHFASRRVYQRVLPVDWSPRQVVRQVIIANILSLVPLFLVLVGVHTFAKSARLAALYVIAGYIGFVLLSQNMGRLMGSRLHALTSGDLRNRIFDLAHVAGVKLRQVYVLPETSAQLSNAFARSDNSVMITSSLLKNLSRREVDGILAHEIGHLQAQHLKQKARTMIGVIVAANVVGTVIVKIAHVQEVGPLVFAAAVGVANLVVFFSSRRNEREADAIGVSLTRDPEAFISGLARLARLNLMPLHSGGWGQSLDTHPATMRRFEEIAKAHGISESRLQELVTDTSLPQDRYPIADDEVEATVFSTEFKHRYRVRVALLVLGVIILAPVPFAAALAREDVSTVGMLGLALGGFVWSFGLSLLVRNRIGFWGYGALGRRLRMKLDKRGFGDAVRQGMLVGLAPAADTRKFEGYPFWDVGVLWLTNEKLFYIGEQCEFALEREQVHEVFSRDTAPEWLPEKSLFVRWKDYSTGPTKTLHFVATGEGSVLQARRAIDSLQQRVQAWMYQSVSFLPAPAAYKSISTPVFPVITSEPALMKFMPAFVFKAAVRLAIFAAVVAFAIRLSYTSIVYVAVTTFVLTVVDELSRAVKDKHRVTQIIPKPASFESGTYQTGSWKNA